MRDFYEVIGLPRGLERGEYLNKYNELKAKYSEDMFLAGEAGNDAAKKLTELESAWMLLDADLEKQKINTEFGSDYGQIDTFVKEGKLDEAQGALDKLMTRDAEWHYYQSAVFYRREWMTECRKHILIALQMDSTNEKYKQTLQKLDLKMGNSQVPPEQFGNYQYTEPQNRGVCGGNSLSNCCAAYCCADCCCSMASSCC